MPEANPEAEDPPLINNHRLSELTLTALTGLDKQISDLLDMLATNESE